MPSRIAKQYRLTDRYENGTVVYSSVDDLGGETQLYVKPDGTMYTYTLVGVCKHCMSSRDHVCKRPESAAPAPESAAIPEPATAVKPESVGEEPLSMIRCVSPGSGCDRARDGSPGSGCDRARDGLPD